MPNRNDEQDKSLGGDISEADLARLKTLFAEQYRWSTLSVSIGDISRENVGLVRDLSRFDPSIAVPMLAGLLTLSDYQSNCIRLEILIALAMAHCDGQKIASNQDIIRWFSLVGESRCVSGEDPAEDVFVSLVNDGHDDYRLLEGIWEAAGFYTQRIIDVVLTMPSAGRFWQIKRSALSLLKISDLVCEKAGLRRYQLGSDRQHSSLSPSKIPSRKSLISRVRIEFDELDALGISPNDIAPFLFHKESRRDLVNQQVGLSFLDRQPLMLYDSAGLVVVLPTALSVAMRDYILATILDGGPVEEFDKNLSYVYSELLSDTPLLGGQRGAPVVWKKIGDHRLAVCCFDVDDGYVLSFHFILPSIKVHPAGGFKDPYSEDQYFSDELQASIKNTIDSFEKRNGFKRGLVVRVGCGWGKGYSARSFETLQPNWRFESLSVADLVRLSWLSDMSPSYFWRIQDGLEAAEKAGVYIINPNGLLNLIGWVRNNKGHFVPHEQLPDGRISRERPLHLNPPLNLLREVRSDSDNGYDRHRVMDNVGKSHDVQRASPAPFFISESSQRIYVSLDDVTKGVLTSVYEGMHKLWLSVTGPNLDNNTVYRLWEMASEWLHRIGNAIDTCESNGCEFRNVRIHVEFLDEEIPGVWGAKPTPDVLASLCVIEAHEDDGACKIVFGKGFVDGFRIAENIAERLVVRTMVQAYLSLLGDNRNEQIASIESRVVCNNEGRCFHLFHAQQFIDYVRKSLPKQLVDIDSLDDASARLGLGWRALSEEESGRIEGREACVDFLNKVVRILLDDIIDILKTFDRISTLVRLVANNEKAGVKEDHWLRTSAAVLGLHGNEPGTVGRFVEETSKFAGAGFASRILAEIALCACPTEEKVRVSDIELSKLIARAALVIRLGGISDAIHYNALPPEIKISPLGDILFRDELGEMVVEPMLARVIGDRYVAEAPRQRKNYDEPTFVPESKSKIDGEFWDAWVIEMGFDLDESRNIIGALEDKGIRDQSAVLLMTRTEYKSLVCSDKVPEEAAMRFLEGFSLRTRARWDVPPPGFNKKDLYPWRFGRRLSFVSRPILMTDTSEDPTLIVAPAFLRKSFSYLVSGAYTGRLEQSFFHSHEMKNVWWGKASEGHTFNAEVASALSGAGWLTRENIELPEILGRKLDKDFGDVDVLAWKKGYDEILVVECKNLSLARNYSEIAELLSDYQGEVRNGTPDKLRRHLNRVELLAENLSELTRLTGIQNPRIKSWLVCSGVVPMQYVKTPSLFGTAVGGIQDILQNHAVSLS